VQVASENQARFDIKSGEMKKPIPKLSVTSEIVKRQNTLTKHLSGSSKIFAVVYVTNPKEIVKLFSDPKLTELNIVIGHKRVHSFRQALDVPTVEKLMELRNEGRLSIFTSDQVHYHSKLFICESESGVKMINGSANLTRTGTGVSGTQWNHIWIAQIGQGYEQHEFYLNECEMFEQYQARTEEFFGNFAEVFDQTPEEKRIEIIENFIESGEVYGLSDDAEIRKVTRLITEQVMDPSLTPDQTLVTIIPSAPMKSLKKVEEKFASIGLQIEDDGKITIPRGAYLNHEMRHYPQMNIDLKNRKLFMGIGGKLVSRTADEMEPNEINNALQSIESYIASVLEANPENPELAQRSVMEALLYIMCSPFHSHYMRLRRSIFGLSEERGPRILHMWGGTSNGKSKLLNYAAKLITGNTIIKPLDGEKFSKTEVESHLGWSSVYPMMWDDLTNDKWTQHMEKVGKNYWDKIWTPDDEFPQLILTSNRQCPRGPLQTRVKEIHFASTFPRNAETRKVLANHLNASNRLYEFFTKLYIDYIVENKDDYEDDESYIGRKVMLELYRISGRKVPSWFPKTCLEDDYNPTAVSIVRAIHRGICTPETLHGELVLRFDESMKKEPWVFKEYIEGIPNEMEVERRGTNIFIRRPHIFMPWLRVGIGFYGKKLPILMRWKLRNIG